MIALVDVGLLGLAGTLLLLGSLDANDALRVFGMLGGADALLDYGLLYYTGTLHMSGFI